MSGLKQETDGGGRARDFFEKVERHTTDQLVELYMGFEEEARRIEEPDVPIHRAFAQQEIHPLTLCSPFVHRTYTKPLGYAGDYEMVNMILRDPVDGANTYARLINHLYLRFGPLVAILGSMDIVFGEVDR